MIDPAIRTIYYLMLGTKDVYDVEAKNCMLEYLSYFPDRWPSEKELARVIIECLKNKK